MKKIAFVFSGQGAQKPGMGLDLLGKSVAAQEVARKASRALGRDMVAALSLEAEEMNRTENTQPLMLMVDLMAGAALKEAGVKPAMVAGFSLGEYAALVASGVLDISEAFVLIQKRAEYMAKAPEGGMAAVLGMSREELDGAIEQVSAGYVAPVNYNAPGQIVVAGEKAAIEELRGILKAQRKRALPLAVSGAFHSKLMEGAARSLFADLEKAQWKKPEIPIYMNIDAKTHEDNFAEIMEKQCMSPVYWEDTLNNMRVDGAEAFVECGPGGVLAGLIKKTLADAAEIYRAEDGESLEAAVSALK